MKKFFPLLCAMLLAACSGDEPADVLANTFGDFKNARYDCMEWQGVQRCYYVVPPQGAPKRFILALHPAFTPVKLAEEMSGLAGKAVRRGDLVVYPEGVDRHWNDGRVARKTKTVRNGTDDVGFLNALMHRMQGEYGVAPEYTAVVGMSNGGMMAQRLACVSDRFRVAGTVVANLPKGIEADCTAKPKAMLMMFGNEDDIVPFGGGPIDSKGKPNSWGEVLSAEETIAVFARHNKCSAEFYETKQGDPAIDGTLVHAREYACGSTPLRVLVLEGMGHTWPGESSRLMAWVTTRGAVSKQLSATDELLGFFGK